MIVFMVFCINDAAKSEGHGARGEGRQGEKVSCFPDSDIHTRAFRRPLLSSGCPLKTYIASKPVVNSPVAYVQMTIDRE